MRNGNTVISIVFWTHRFCTGKVTFQKEFEVQYFCFFYLINCLVCLADSHKNNIQHNEEIQLRLYPFGNLIFFKQF
jgi:hypothetical protein